MPRRRTNYAQKDYSSPATDPPATTPPAPGALAADLHAADLSRLPHLDLCSSMVSAHLNGSGLSMRVTFDLAGVTWFKISIRTERWPKHYILVSTRPGVPFSTGMRKILDKYDDFCEGKLKPSPDKWED